MKRSSSYPSPPSAKEFYDMVRRHEREVEIPSRVRRIQKWIHKIKADPDDVRNGDDIRKKKGGGTFTAMTTDLDSILKTCDAVLQKFQAGEFLLALSAMRTLEARVREINDRKIKPLIEIGQKVTEGAKRGGRPKTTNRNLRMAREFLARRETSKLSDTALKEQIGKPYKLTRSPAVDAVNKGLKEIVPKPANRTP